MAKNTASSAFRKIDVDAFNEDNFKDDDGPISPDTNNRIGNEAEITALNTKGKGVEALKAYLSGAPIGNKNQAEKVQFWVVTIFDI